VKQFIAGLALGATITGTGALAVELAKGSGNPLEHLPVQTQINQIINAVDAQFDNIHEGFAQVGVVFADIDRRLTALENAKK
jgi:hypothetical protein